MTCYQCSSFRSQVFRKRVESEILAEETFLSLIDRVRSHLRRRAIVFMPVIFGDFQVAPKKAARQLLVHSKVVRLPSAKGSRVDGNLADFVFSLW
jgi:hypothetical protein